MARRTQGNRFVVEEKRREKKEETNGRTAERVVKRDVKTYKSFLNERLAARAITHMH